MEPAIKAGSFLLVIESVQSIKIGDILLFLSPNQEKLVKRVARIEDGKYFMTGDNPNDSLDSRSFGLISQDKIIGKIIWK